ncbi:hypothetical protein PVAND_009113 [Polypedilum vanderplanki]|uniref:ELMO domain-containing protein n=1 Tax=Polypedilum vanderplanki TaxID=319348 RepID=A0A9J6CBM8_POLVA|nr:hypothetical protein PVAND_009113 [Polypedilum vanderplanki]
MKNQYHQDMLPLSNYLNTIYLFFRPLIKWFLHRFTNLCELQRLVYGAPDGYRRYKLVERSLYLSKRPQIKNLVYCLNEITSHCIPESLIDAEITTRAIDTILNVKKIKPKYHPGFSDAFGRCIDGIYTYKMLESYVEKLRLQQYSSENFEHEQKLLLLWNNLMPNIPLENRITKQWQQIGFQGDDPSTDFRGMGILALDNLLFFSSEYSGTARHILSHSQHPKYGYTLAVVGINITHMAWRLLKSGQAKSHFYNLSRTHGYLNIEHFHQFYCYLLYEFDSFWIKLKPNNLMEFNNVQERFEKSIVKSTEKENCLFKMNLSVENV